MNKQLKNGKIETDEWEKRKTHYQLCIMKL